MRMLSISMISSALTGLVGWQPVGFAYKSRRMGGTDYTAHMWLKDLVPL